MSDQSTPTPTDPEALRTRLLECARLLRATRHLEPDTRQAVADLVSELAAALGATAAPSEHAAHLAATSAQLVDALHDQHDAGLVTAARHRLEEVAARAEAKAPVAAGVVRRLIDALASIGI